MNIEVENGIFMVQGLEGGESFSSCLEEGFLVQLLLLRWV